MTETFAHRYGVKISEDERGSLASLHITKPYLNGFNCAFGGSLILLGNTAGQHAIGKGLIGSNYSFRYMRKALEGETMTAIARVLKSGKNINAVAAAVNVNGQMIGSMYADYFHVNDHLPFDDARNLAQIKQPPCDMIINSPENPSAAASGPELVRLFTDTITFNYLKDVNIKESVCVGMYTDESFADVNGNVDPALVGMLYDETLGIACIDVAGAVVTTNLNLSLLESIKPGAFITCAGKLLIQSGYLLETRGTLFADGKLVGSCTGTYLCQKQITNVREMLNI